MLKEYVSEQRKYIFEQSSSGRRPQGFVLNSLIGVLVTTFETRCILEYHRPQVFDDNDVKQFLIYGDLHGIQFVAMQDQNHPFDLHQLV